MRTKLVIIKDEKNIGNKYEFKREFSSKKDMIAQYKIVFKIINIK